MFGEIASSEANPGRAPLAQGRELDERIPVLPGGTLYVDLDYGAVEVESHDLHEVVIEWPSLEPADERP